MVKVAPLLDESKLKDKFKSGIEDTPARKWKTNATSADALAAYAGNFYDIYKLEVKCSEETAHLEGFERQAAQGECMVKGYAELLKKAGAGG